MLAVVQIGSSTLRSECMTARIVLVWAKAGDTARRATAAESRALTFTRFLIAGRAPLQWRVHFWCRQRRATGVARPQRSALPARRRTRARRDVGLARRLHLGHVLVALGGEPQRVVAHLDRRILRRLRGRLAGRQTLDHGVVVGIAEERHGVAPLPRKGAPAVW